MELVCFIAARRSFRNCFRLMPHAPVWRLYPTIMWWTETDIEMCDDARRFEIGNFNYSGICAMSSALDLILGVGIEQIERHVLGLDKYLSDKLAERQIERLGPVDLKRGSSRFALLACEERGGLIYFSAER